MGAGKFSARLGTVPRIKIYLLKLTEKRLTRAMRARDIGNKWESLVSLSVGLLAGVRIAPNSDRHRAVYLFEEAAGLDLTYANVGN